MKISEILFRNRSYAPIPFLIIMVIFAKPALMTLIIGIAIAFLGETIRFWGVGYIGPESRVTGGVGGSKLMISGPYSMVRNPLYIGNILIYCGIGVASNALFPYLLAAAFVYFVFQYYMIVLDEEKYLLNTFKDSFVDYRKHVGRFFPKFKKYESPEKISYKFDFMTALRSERRTLQGFSITLIVIICIWIYQTYVR
jgi:protein-S-isoprenylcysteine O-methyltransferase Ste14